MCLIGICQRGILNVNFNWKDMTMADFDANSFSDILVRAWKDEKTYPYQCCCPGCQGRAIKSHLLQQHPVLASICDKKNNVLQLVDNDIDPRSRKWNFYNKRNVGITNALQYKLFCKRHDSGLFKPIEQQNSIPASKRDCLLLSFRSACAVRHQEEHRLHIYEYQYKSCGVKSLMEDSSHLFIHRMNGVVDNLWKAIKEDGDNHYLFRMIAMPRIDIAASDCMIDENDFEAHILEGDYDAPLNCMFINLIPTNDSLLILLGCDTRYDKDEVYQRIIMDFPTGDVTSDYNLSTLKGILLKCSNWCCSPKLYEDRSWKEFFDKYEHYKVKVTMKS